MKTLQKIVELERIQENERKDIKNKNHPLIEIVRDFVKRAVNTKLVTVDQLATHAKITNPVVYYFISGHKVPRTETLIRFAEFLGFDEVTDYVYKELKKERDNGQ